MARRTDRMPLQLTAAFLAFAALSLTCMQAVSAHEGHDHSATAKVAPAPAPRKFGPVPAPAPGPALKLRAGEPVCDQTVLQYLKKGANAQTYSYLLQMIEYIGASEYLDDTSAEMTVFLPSNAGIDSQLKVFGVTAAILTSASKSTLDELVKYHIIPQPLLPITTGKYATVLGPAAQLTLNAANPSNVTVTSAANTVTTPSATGVRACSAVIYPVSGVLIPPSLAPLVAIAG